MIKFKEHDGLIFKMLDEPTPLTPETEMPCLVRLIQDDSPMGLHNKDLHGYDPEGLTPKICTEVIDVNDLSNPKRGSVRYDGYISGQYYHFEIIGTPVAEGSEDWAWYQMMQGEIYKEPEPLLAEAKVGDLCQRRDGKWVQIDRLLSIGGMPWICYEIGGLRYINNGEQLNSKLSELGIISTEPIAPEGTAEWAWQMLKLQKPVSHPAEGELQDTDYTKEGFVRCMAKTGWQLYEPKPESENIIHDYIPAGLRLKYIHLYEEFKVGDWVEIERKGKTYHKQVILIDDDGFARVEFSSSKMKIADIGETSLLGFKTIRKLDPSEVVIHIGCLSGTVRRINDIFFCLNPSTKKGWVVPEATIPLAMLDTTTAELVRELLKAQEKGE